jgi:hypothetical protein
LVRQESLVGIDYDAISAWAAVVAAFAALVAALAAVIAISLEGKRARFAQGLDLLVRWREAFDTEDFKKKRRAVAKLLSTEGGWFERGKRLEDVEDILNHFQLIGYLRSRGILDRELVWEEYYFMLNHYYHLLKPYVASVREWDPTLWGDVDWLLKDLTGLERKALPKGGDTRPTEETSEEFLLRESNL